MPQPIDEERVDAAIAALDSIRRQWLRRPGVSAVDVGFKIKDDELKEDTLALRVHVVRKRYGDDLPDEERFPTEHEDFPVDVIEVDYEVSAARGNNAEDDEAVDPRARLSPLQGGISVGNPRVTAGTLGAIVWDREDGWPGLLSNWHVLAGNDAFTGGCTHPPSAGQPFYHAAGTAPNVTGLEPFYHAAGLQPFYHATGVQPFYHAAGLEPFYHPASSGRPFPQAAVVGEPIYQPGRFDGGTAADTVAVLERALLDRHVDAAVARLTGARAYSPTIHGLGPLTGVAEPRLGMRLRKSGRSSGLTRGRVDGVSLSTNIDWGSERHYFEDQIHIVPLDPWPKGPYDDVSEGGDSGAVWVDEDSGRAVGLHFAGDTGGVTENEHALANRMSRVLDALRVDLDPPLRVIDRPADEQAGLAAGLLRSLGGGGFGAVVGAVATGMPPSWRPGAPPSDEELTALRALIDVVLAGRR